MYSGPAIATFTQIREKSGSTNLPEGVVHIYRTPPESLAEPTQPPGNASTSAATSGSHDDASKDIADAGVLIAVLAVPAWMTPSDFLAFVSPAADGMSHLRMIRYVALESEYRQLRC